MEPLISICIASYNNCRYLKRMLDSAISQTYKNIEIIIVDDGSTDETREVLNAYSDNEKCIIVYKENGGLSSTRQQAMELANGEYLCFVDGDDYLSPTFVEKMYDKISVEQADICLCGTLFLDVAGNVLERETQEYSVKQCIVQSISVSELNSYYMALTSKFFMSDSWNKLYKREFLIKHNLSFSMPKGLNGSDLIFNHKVLLFCPTICTLDSDEYCHVMYKTSAVHRPNKNLLASYQITIDELICISKTIPGLCIMSQLKLLYTNFSRNSLQDIYLEKKNTNKDFKEVEDTYLRSCDFYESRFKKVKCGYISKALKLFSYILSIKQVRILRLYLKIRCLLVYKKLDNI